MSRLTILSDKEQREFDSPPILSVEAQAVCFAIDETLDKILRRLHSKASKIGFLLQYAYFKACRRFFLMKRYRQEDIEYAAKILGFPKNCPSLRHYKERTARNHQTKILSYFQCKAFGSQHNWIEQEIKNRVDRVIEPRALFFEMLHQLHEHNIEVPNYHTLAEFITEHYLSHEETLLSKIESALNANQKTVLDKLLTAEKNRPLA